MAGELLGNTGVSSLGARAGVLAPGKRVWPIPSGYNQAISVFISSDFCQLELYTVKPV